MDSTERMRRLIEEALDHPDEGPERLQRWLQGLDLPPLGSEEEPYIWILRGLSEIEERAQAEQILASWTAEIIDRQPDVEPIGRFPDRLLYNLFFLAGGLARPGELWEPLLRVYERRALEGSHLGFDHRRNLVRALSRNQSDARLEEDWRLLARGELVEFLEGATLDGLWAVVLMPHPERGPGYPALDAIGEALDHQVKELEGQPYRRRQFLELCDRIMELHVDRKEQLQLWFVQTAHRLGWPEWAVEGLPSLWFRDESLGRGSAVGRVVVWEPYARYLRENTLGSVTLVCNGRVAQIDLAREITQEQSQLLGTFEESRRGNPYSSHRALLGDVRHAVASLSSEADDEVEEVHRELLSAAGVPGSAG